MYKVLINALWFIMVFRVFRCHGNIYVMLLFSMHVFARYMAYIVGPINVCTNFEINRYTIDEFRKHAKIVCNAYILHELQRISFYVGMICVGVVSRAPKGFVRLL